MGLGRFVLDGNLRSFEDWIGLDWTGVVFLLLLLLLVHIWEG